MAVVVVRDRRTRVRRRRPAHAQARRRCGLHVRRVRLARRLGVHIRHRHCDRLPRGLLPRHRAARRRHYHHVRVVAPLVFGVLVVRCRVERQLPGRRHDGEERPVRAAGDRVARDAVIRVAVRRHHRAGHRLVLRRVERRVRRERRRRVHIVRQDLFWQVIRPGEDVAVVVVGQARVGGEVDVRGHRLVRPGRAGDGDRRALHRAGRHTELHRAASEHAVGHLHRKLNRERRPREHLRPHLIGPHLLQRHGQRFFVFFGWFFVFFGFFKQPERFQRGQAGEHAVGKRGERVAEQIELLQRGQAGEHASGKRVELVVVQIELLQRRQLGEHASGKLAELVAAQRELLQLGQLGEHAVGKRTELGVAQKEGLQRRQLGEHVLGKRTEFVFRQSEVPQSVFDVGEHVGGHRTEFVVAQIDLPQCWQLGEHASGKRTEFVGIQ